MLGKAWRFYLTETLNEIKKLTERNWYD